MTKKWVFGELVSSHDDLEGLLAYSIYKHAKHEYICGLRKDGLSEPEIKLKADGFHDVQVACTPSLQGYRTQASNFLDILTSSIEAEKEQALSKIHITRTSELDERERKLDLKETLHAQMVVKDRKGLEKDRTAIRKEEVIKLQAAAKNITPQSKKKRIGLWLLSGFAGIAALLITVSFTYVVMLITQTDVSRAALTEKAVKSVMSVVATPPVPLDDLPVTPQKSASK